MNQRAVIGKDGVSRRLFTASDVMRMVEVGLIEEEERLELVDGELHAMSPAGVPHEILKQHLNLAFARQLQPGQTFVPECTWVLGPLLVLVPDFLFFPAATTLPDVTGPDASLVVEIADSSLGRDMGLKARLYAGLGVRESWVIDAVERAVHVHRDPAPAGYRTVRRYAADESVAADHAPGIALRLADLPAR